MNQKLMQSLLRGYVLGMRTSVFCRSGEDDRDKKVKASVAAALLFTPIVYSDDLWLGYTGDLLQTGCTQALLGAVQEPLELGPHDLERLSMNSVHEVLQQMAPMNGAAGPGAAAAPAAPLDEALLRQEKMRQHLQQAAAAQSAVGWSLQPAVMQQLVTQLNQMHLFQQQQQQSQQASAAAVAAPVVVKKTAAASVPQALHPSPSNSAACDATQRSPSEYYSAVVARRSPTYRDVSSGSSKSNAPSTITRPSDAPVKLERKGAIY
ncbi:unnamed protein product [Heligmosomoides polygyrus]|uniref:Uncharacterized protein n=1 Tax=Heligmosomoides polygyrus TaxID=6339 RepID=A0A3P7XDH0_HELPZ|nr:unnamed protein product [Heligmosomoides polygyrus]